jgi:hypothetical protein
MASRRGLKTKKWQIEAKPTWHHFGGKMNRFTPTKKRAQMREAHDLENQDAKLGFKASWSNSRIQFATNESKLLPRNLGSTPHPHLKSAFQELNPNSGT